MGDTNLDRALEVKKRGNELYLKGEFVAAIDLYSEAIGLCPAEKMSDLAILYQNRAVANDRLDKLHEALADCDMSLKMNNRWESGTVLNTMSNVRSRTAC